MKMDRMEREFDTYNVWGRKEVSREIWLRNPKKRKHWENGHLN